MKRARLGRRRSPEYGARVEEGGGRAWRETPGKKKRRRGTGAFVTSRVGEKCKLLGTHTFAKCRLVQGHLVHKRMTPPRILQYAYAQDFIVDLGGERFL